MTVTNKRLVEILTTAMEKPEIANALIQRVINTLDKQEREWQGLTEYEVGFLTVFDGLHDVEVPLLANFIRHIEAKLKEKNGG